MTSGDLPQAVSAGGDRRGWPHRRVQWIAADVPAFEPGSAHAGAHSLDDQVAFELGDRTDDDDDGPAQRAGRVDLFAEADELDIDAVQLVQDFEEVLG